MSLREVIAELDVEVRGLAQVRQATAGVDAFAAALRPAVANANRAAQSTFAVGASASQSAVGVEELAEGLTATGGGGVVSALSVVRLGIGAIADALHVARFAFDVARVAVGAFVDQLQAIIEQGGQIDDLSQQLGVSARRLQEWGYIAEQSGTTLETITRGLDQVARTAGRGADVYQRLGVATRGAGGEMRSQEEILNDTLSALAGVENGAERTALAQQVFGRGAREMLGIVGQGPEALAELRKRFRELGGGMSDDSVAASAAAGDALNDLRIALRSLRDTLAPVVLPAITELVRALATGVGRLVDWARNTSLLSNAMAIATYFIEDWWDQMRAIGTGLAVVAAPLIAFVLVVDDLMTAFRGGESVIGTWVEQFAAAHGQTLTFLGVIESMRIRLLELRQAALDTAAAVAGLIPGGGDALATIRAAQAQGSGEIDRARAQLAVDERERFAERGAFARRAALASDDASKRAAAQQSVQLQTTVNVTAADPEAAARAVAREQRRELRRAADALGRAEAPA